MGGATPPEAPTSARGAAAPEEPAMPGMPNMPGMDPSAYANMMSGVLQNPQFVEMAEKLGQQIMQVFAGNGCLVNLQGRHCLKYYKAISLHEGHWLHITKLCAQGSRGHLHQLACVVTQHIRVPHANHCSMSAYSVTVKCVLQQQDPLHNAKGCFYQHVVCVCVCCNSKIPRWQTSCKA